MGRKLFVLYNADFRRKAIDMILASPKETRVTIAEPKRSLDQNAKLWPMLAEIAEQVEWYGQKLSDEDWKDIFTASLRKARVVPGLDPGTCVALGMRTSKMGKEEFSNLLELIHAFAAERGVVFHEPQRDDPPPIGERAA